MQESQAPEIPQIKVTKDYAQFKLMRGNREVNYNHVKRLKRELQANPHLMPARPIIVNEHMFIVEGQHSKLAAQELNKPIYYIVIPGATVADTRNLNVTQKRWSLLDFARSYADSGREDYKIFLETYKKFPKIAPSILRTYLAGGQRHQINLDFSRGEFKIENESESIKHVEMLDSVISKTGVKINAPLAYGFLKLLSNKEFDYSLFIKKLDHDGAKELLRPAPSLRQCLRSIEDVYNFQSKHQKRLY